MWTFEQDSTNAIDIYKDDVIVAQIITDWDTTENEIAIAKFICDSCNKNS